MKTMQLKIIGRLLSMNGQALPEAPGQFNLWRRHFFDQAAKWNHTADKAIIGGFSTDCIAYAFVAGYFSALQSLVPDLPANRVVSFCVTESGGPHPKAIKTSLVPGISEKEKNQIYTLTGEKKYITCAGEAETILVAASEGIDKEGKNKIRMVIVDAKAPGISITLMKDIGMIPEISHGMVTFDNVTIQKSALLSGDGYTHYIKPFRTIEDLHVSAAVMGYLFRIACRYGWDRKIKQYILARLVTIRNLTLCSPDAPEVHIVAGEVLSQTPALFKRLEPYWETVDNHIKEAWNRDKALMNLAQNARGKRLETAWAFFEKKIRVNLTPIAL